jgi:hypothetical protein
LSQLGVKGKRLQGPAIKNKSETALKECKKLLAYWFEFVNGGDLLTFSSGLTAMDALEYCVRRYLGEDSWDGRRAAGT